MRIRGSSPLARGLQPDPRLHQGRPRIIPARAGFTPPIARDSTSRPDHPRSRGVYLSPLTMISQVIGSSPLARGLQPCHPSESALHGIIPARAGFTRDISWSNPLATDHPRSRGVYQCWQYCHLPDDGSSPLARGLPPSCTFLKAFTRIIPARAGFTGVLRGLLFRRGDHPRSRGVYSSNFSLEWEKPGSSPLARGLHRARFVAQEETGIIPARAGFTGVSNCTSGPWSDHPRSRGVYAPPAPAAEGGTGSSPLARGLLQTIWTGIQVAGIIPARAGFTRPSSPPRSKSSDHPRSRGVYGGECFERGFAGGSSPLARGLPVQAVGAGYNLWIIPARAGFTGARASISRTTPDHPRSRGVY